MNALTTALFFLFAAVALAGALATALAGSRPLRGLGLLLVGVGAGGLCFAASAGYAGGVLLIAFAGLGALFAYPNPRSLRGEGLARPAHQLGALGAAGLLVMLAYAAFRGAFAHGEGPPGSFNAGDVGRLLFSHEALATEAVAALLLASVSGAAVAWWGRER